MGCEHNVSVFKEPRGFIKIAELVFVIVAFSVLASVKYAFGDDDLFFEPPRPTNISTGRYRASGSFYEFVGVAAFLYVIGIGACYVFLEVKLPAERLCDVMQDFVVTAILAFFWLVCSSVWAQAADGVPSIVDDLYVGLDSSASKPSYGVLIVAVILGFLNFFLWAGNCWFVLKETQWFRSRKKAYAETKPFPRQAEAKDEPAAEA